MIGYLFRISGIFLREFLLLPQNHRIRPYDVGALVSAGVFSVDVQQKPRVAIIPTGSELVNHKDVSEARELKENEIIEKLKKAILEGDIDVAPEVTQEALNTGVNAECIREKAVSQGIAELEEKLYGNCKVWGNPYLFMGMADFDATGSGSDHPAFEGVDTSSMTNAQKAALIDKYNAIWYYTDKYNTKQEQNCKRFLKRNVIRW